MSMTYAECYRVGREQLEVAGIQEAELEARLLLEHLLGTARHDLIVRGDRVVSEEHVKQYFEWIAMRVQRIPMGYIIGHTTFMGLQFLTDTGILIPRQDTEVLVEEVLCGLHDGMHILDLCTGSGCILLSLLHYSNDCKGVGVDLDPRAISLAMRNAECLGETADWREGDLWEVIGEQERFECIVSNPPYIPTNVIETLMPEVRLHESHLALDGREDGLFFYRRIVASASQYLCQGGMLYFEIGHDQGAAVSELLAMHSYSDIKIVQDLTGNDRVVSGRYSKE